LKNNDFFDETSKTIYNQLAQTSSSVYSRATPNIERFEISSSMLQLVQNRYGNNISINIQGGRPAIEIQESLFSAINKKAGE
jgi:hypothetical protein